MRLKEKRLILAAVLACAARAIGAEEPSSPVAEKVAEIHLPPGSRLLQLGELVRQINVSVFVDVGRDWKDQARPEIVNDMLWPAFSFKKGTVGEALDAFCKERKEYQWRYWKEAHALWVEPQAEAHRAADFYLRRAFKSSPALMKETEGWRLYANYATPVWGETRYMPSEKRTDFRIYTEGGGLRVPTGAGPLYLVLPKPEAPKDALSFAQVWLLGGPGRFGALEVSENPGIVVGAERTVELQLGALFANLALSSIADVVSGLFLKSEVPQGYEFPSWRRINCERELYRRYRADPDVALKALRNFLERAKDDDLRDHAWQFITWDPAGFGGFFIAEFERGSREVKLRLLNSRALPEPAWHGPESLGFWEKLAASDDAEFKQQALSNLEDYKEKKKNPNWPNDPK